jgi:hypothetical protein
LDILLIGDFPNSQQFDDSAASPVGCIAFLYGFVGEGEGGVEATLTEL